MIPRPLLDDPSRAWAPFEPGAGAGWDLPRVAHLHRRAGFAASWDVLRRDLRDGPEAAVARLLDGDERSLDGLPAATFERRMDDLAADLGSNIERLREAWLYRMVHTPHPLRERMTLFWHDHFATSNAKVANAHLMRRQNALLREHALGNFGELLLAIGRDPAMLVWLDATENRRGHANENYAREVMELFALGRGAYGEADIREAARAFTGRSVQGETYREVPEQHDDGTKSVLGRSGPLDGDDVARILLEQPACAGFLCGKLFRLLVSEVDEPPAALLDPLARAFRASGYDVMVPLGTILRSTLFYHLSVRRRRVKGPVESVVGTLRALEVVRPTVPARALAEACGRMRQALFEPPSVAGWDDGTGWIDSSTTLARSNFALALAAAESGPFSGRFDAKALVDRRGASDAADFFADLLVQDALAADLRGRIRSAASGRPADAAAREAAALVLSAPEYQLA